MFQEIMAKRFLLKGRSRFRMSSPVFNDFLVSNGDTLLDVFCPVVY